MLVPATVTGHCCLAVGAHVPQMAAAVTAAILLLKNVPSLPDGLGPKTFAFSQGVFCLMDGTCLLGLRVTARRG